MKSVLYTFARNYCSFDQFINMIINLHLFDCFATDWRVNKLFKKIIIEFPEYIPSQHTRNGFFRSIFYQKLNLFNSHAPLVDKLL